MEDAILERGGADLGVVSRQQAGELTQEQSMTMRRLALQASLALDHKRRWKRALHHAAKHYEGRTTCWTIPLVLATWSESSQETNKRFLASRRGHQQHVGHSLDCLPWFRSQVCTISGADRFTTMTRQPMNTSRNTRRNLGERPLQEGDLSYEDITGQDEPPVDSPPAPRENTCDKTPKTQRRRTDGGGPKSTKTNANARP